MSRGFSLLEALVACAVLAIASGALLFALSRAAHFAGHSTIGPARAAAQTLAESTMRDVQDAWKYGAPGSINATAGSVSVSSTGSGPGTISVTVTYSPDPSHQDSGTITLSAPATVRAPLPGSQVARPALIADPSATPTP